MNRPSSRVGMDYSINPMTRWVRGSTSTARCQNRVLILRVHARTRRNWVRVHRPWQRRSHNNLVLNIRRRRALGYGILLNLSRLGAESVPPTIAPIAPQRATPNGPPTIAPSTAPVVRPVLSQIRSLLVDSGEFALTGCCKVNGLAPLPGPEMALKIAYTSSLRQNPEKTGIAL